MASTYDLVNYDSDEEREKYPDIPPSNLASAAFFMAGLLDRAGIPYGLMGGLAVAYMGSTRATRDVDMAFQAPGKMREMWRLVEAEPRLIIPNTRLLSNIMKVFVRTGPGYDNCQQAIPIEVDLIESGYQNSPRDLSVNRRELSLNTRAGPRTIYAIELLFLLRGKLAAFAARARRTDLEDIQHLARTYGPEIQTVLNRLDPETVTAFLERVHPAELRVWRAFFRR